MALIVSLVVLVLLTLLAVTGLRLAVVEEQVSGNQRLAAGALFAAEQGVAGAIGDLLNGTVSIDGAIDWSASGSVSGTGYSANYTLAHLLSADGSKVEDDDGRSYLLINSTGQSAGGAARRLVEVAVALEIGGAGNVAGLIGCQGVTGLSNVTTASYSSSGQPTNYDRGDVATTDAGALMYLVGSSDFDVNGEIRSTGWLYLDSDALIRRDALATNGIWMKSGDIYGSAYTNGSFIDDGGTVHTAIHQGDSVQPNPIVPLTTCDPWDIDAIFTEASAIKTANNTSEDLGVGSGSSFTPSGGSIGISGAARDYYFSYFELGSDAVLTVYGDVRIYARDYFWMQSNSQLILASGASLTVYVEQNYFWMDSNSRANHDPDNYFPECDPGGCPINLKVYVLTENYAKDLISGNYEPDVWDPAMCEYGKEASECYTSVKLDSNTVFYGLIYAPKSHIVFNSNANVHGSARGAYVTTDSNMAFTYDEDLDALYTGVPTDYQIVYWSEQYPEDD